MMASSGTVRPIAACPTLPVRSTRSLADFAKLVDGWWQHRAGGAINGDSMKGILNDAAQFGIVKFKLLLVELLE
jgi:hypothetical protein